MEKVDKILSKVGYAAAIDEKNISEAIIFAKENGMGAVEISMNVPAFLPQRYEKAERAEIKKLAEENGISLSLHGPENLSFLNIQPKLLWAAKESYKEIIDFADDIGAKRITVHIGDNVCYTLTDKKVYLDDLYPEIYKEILFKVLRELRDYAKGKAYLCLENTGRFNEFLSEALDELLKEGDLYLTFDWGHAHNKPIQQQFMLSHKEYIRNCHVHDNNGKSDHQILFTGEVPIMKYIDELYENDLNFIIEVRPRDKAVEAFSELKKAFGV